MKKVLTPIKVGGMELKNRVMFLAMAKSIANPDNTVSDRQLAYYENIAKGGVGLMTTGACITFPDYPSKIPMQPGIYDDKFIPGLKKLADAVHKHGAKMILQPWHPGITPYGCAPSDLKQLADYTVEEIHDMQNTFVQGAIRIKKAGFDGVEVHAAHNYLNEQFLTPLFNKRTDEYGAQNMENGLRFTTEIIQMIKKECGADFPVIVKINGNDFNPDGMNVDRLVEAGPILEKAGADMISVSAGGGLTRLTGMSADGTQPEGWKVPLAEALKKVVTIPVMATGSIRHPEYVEEILSEGKCDMVGIGRGLLADPEWIKKVEEDREDEIRPCISCMTCFSYDNVFDPTKSGCGVNPLATREWQHVEVKEDGDGKTAVVVGGGPAGMQAAITLAQRGFKPVLFEKANELGGIETLAAAPDGKAKIAWHIDYLKTMLKKLDVDVRLGTEATADAIRALNPYGVIMAAGSNPIVPRAIPGIDKEHVVESRTLLANIPDVTGKNIVVIGAGLVGLETAHTLAHKGNKVTVIDMLPTPDPATTSTDLKLATGYAMASGVVINMEHKLLEITDEAVMAENQQTGETVAFPADRVVLCLGSRPNTALYDELKDEFERIYNVGDAVNVRKIVRAVQDGFDAAVSM